MTHSTTTNTTSSTARAMGNGNKKFASNSFSPDGIPKDSSKVTKNKDVAKWSSAEVQSWIKEQCIIFELKKATAEKFKLNGQALVLLSKHDFLRRSPDGGEILYYALQRLINPSKINLANPGIPVLKNGSSDQHPRIVEVNGDNNEYNGATDSSSYPIIEEPDDPPKIQRSRSDTPDNNYQQQQHPQGFFNNPARIRPSFFPIPADFFHQQHQRFPNAFTYAHRSRHPNLHMHQQAFQQYNPLMFAQAVIVEELDDAQRRNLTPDVLNELMNGNYVDSQEPLYFVTYNGKRSIMNEGQITQLVHQISQQQAYQTNLQQQQQQQQQYFHQQQQQQQRFQQQQQQHFQQQPQSQQYRF